MDREVIEKFMEITGESEATARQYLSLTDGNVEMAVSLMFEEGQEPQAQSVDPEPEVRPPILPTREILVDSEPMFSYPRLPNVFDRFRDFALETQRQEEELTLRVSGVKETSQPKKRFEDLFRPPYNILFLGSFMDAREHAKCLNRWLLVNIQDPQEFVCQVLNRDVWSNEQIQEIVKDHFVLWQVLSNTKDGKNYIDFYTVENYPYLAVIDPRTGECIQKYNHITKDSLISDLNDILSTHASPEGASNETYNHKSDKRPLYAKESKPTESLKSAHASCSQTTGIVEKRKRLDDTDLYTETLEKEEKVVNKMQDDKTETSTDSDKPSLRLCLRLPNGSKETISMCANDTVKDFLRRMNNMGFPDTDYTYLVPFPKTNIGTLAETVQLSDTVLFPSNTVFISKT